MRGNRPTGRDALMPKAAYRAMVLFYLLAMMLHYVSTSALPKLAGVLLIPMAILVLLRRNDPENVLPLLRASCIWYIQLAMLTCLSCILWLTTLQEPSYVQPGAVKLLHQLINITVAVSAVYLFREQAAEFAFWGILVCHVLHLSEALATYGCSTMVSDLMATVLEGGQVGFWTAMELNAVTYSMGYFALYFTLWPGQLSKRRRVFYAALAYGFFLTGFKRIGLAAMLVALVGALLLKRLRGQGRKAGCYVLQALTMLTCIVYIPLIRNGTVVSLLSRLGIDPMSRDGLYQFVQGCYTFSVDFPGHGFGYITEYLNRAKALQLQYAGAGAHYIHNDVLLFYIEQGFLGFLCWLGMRCLVQQRWWLKRDMELGVIYCVFNLFSFMTYATDNTSVDYQITLTYRILLMSIWAQMLYKAKRGES